MEIYFKDKNTEEVIHGIQEKIGGRKLGDLLHLESEGSDIKVTIKKMGTSILEFSHHHKDGGHSWVLSKEKLAMTHRAFKGEIMDKLKDVVESLGGNFTA